MPITGNETVLDAINYAGGLIATAAPTNIRLVRPAPPGACCEQILPVNLAAIINAGDPTTNYQLMPGDRLVVYRDPKSPPDGLPPANHRVARPGRRRGPVADRRAEARRGAQGTGADPETLTRVG